MGGHGERMGGCEELPDVFVGHAAFLLFLEGGRLGGELMKELRSGQSAPVLRQIGTAPVMLHQFGRMAHHIWFVYLFNFNGWLFFLETGFFLETRKLFGRLLLEDGP